MRTKILFLLMLTCQFTLASPFKNMDVFELEVAASPQIASDGNRIVYERRAMDIMSDKVRTNIWIVDTDGNNHRPLLSGDANYTSPRWSPTGDRIAFISAAGAHGAELHVRWLDTGQTALLTQLPSAPNAVTWSPDGSLLAFSSLVETEAVKLAKPPQAPKDAEWAPAATIVDRLRFRADGQGYLKQGNSHIFIVPADGGTPRQLTDGDYNHGGQITWSPDGTTIIISANRNRDWELKPLNSDLWSVDVASSEMTQLTTRDGPDRRPTFSPDGKSIAYLGFDDHQMGFQKTGVYLRSLATGDTTALTENLDRSVQDVQWAGNSRSLLIGYDDHGKRLIARLKRDGKLSTLTDKVGSSGIGRPYTSGGFTVAANGSFAFTMSSTDRPADVGFGSSSRNIQRLTDLNSDLLSQREAASVEEITWTSHGDLAIQGWLVKPPGFDPGKKYPLILEIHGGPFTAYGPHFSIEVQLYAAAGYVVLYTNPRGSTSYGYDFANEIHHNYPGDDFLDLMSGVDAVISQGFVDEEQLFVTGGSGGGVLTAWIVGKTDRFKAAAAAKPVINWTSETLYSDISAMVPRYWFDKPPWEDQENYWRRSPLSLVGNVSTPTMLLTGERDYRTPIAESEQFYQALKLREVDTLLVRIPEASHSIYARPSHLIAKVDNILAWFAKYRGDQSATPPP